MYMFVLAGRWIQALYSMYNIYVCMYVYVYIIDI